MNRTNFTLSVFSTSTQSFLRVVSFRRAMSMPVSSHVDAAQDLPIKRLAGETAKLVAGGAKIVNMGQGVPNLPIFNAARDAVKELVDSRQLPYVDVCGDAGVRQSCINFINSFYTFDAKAPLNLTPDHTIVCGGAIQGVYNSLALVVDGERSVVLTPKPAYGLYRHQTGLLKGKFGLIDSTAKTGFIPTREELIAAFRAHTKVTHAGTDAHPDGVRHSGVRALVLCLPNNPTGAVVSDAQAKSIADTLHELLVEYRAQSYHDGRGDGKELPRDVGFLVVLDEVYIGTGFGSHVSIIKYASPLLLNHILLVLSASKGLGSAPGARASWVTAFDKKLVTQMNKIQLACSGNSSTLAQATLKASLNHILASAKPVPAPESKQLFKPANTQIVLNGAGSIEYPVLTETATYYRARVNFVIEYLNTVLAVRYGFDTKPVKQVPASTFYVFADFSAVIALSKGRVKTDIQFLNYLRDMHTEKQIPAPKADSKSNGELTAGSIAAVATVNSDQTGLALVPGMAFDVPSEAVLMRFSCAKTWPELHVAMSVLDRAFAKLAKEAAAAN